MTYDEIKNDVKHTFSTVFHQNTATALINLVRLVFDDNVYNAIEHYIASQNLDKDMLDIAQITEMEFDNFKQMLKNEPDHGAMYLYDNFRTEIAMCMLKQMEDWFMNVVFCMHVINLQKAQPCDLEIMRKYKVTVTNIFIDYLYNKLLMAPENSVTAHALDNCVYAIITEDVALMQKGLDIIKNQLMEI